MKHFFKKAIYEECGVATLPTVIMLTLFVVAIGVGITALSFSETVSSTAQNQSALALSYAYAGGRDGLMRVARIKNYTCDSPSSGCYQIDFATNGCLNNNACASVTVSAATSPKIIISSGCSGNVVRTIQTAVTLDVSGNGEITGTTWEEVIN